MTALEKKGYVRREPDPQDQRRLVLFITAAGRKMHNRFMPGLKRREEAMMQCLSPQELDNFENLLRKLCGHASTWRDIEHV